MKLVIDISEEDYKKVSTIVDMGLGTNIDEAIKNGTPLPEKHGRLIDVNNIVYEKESIMQNDGCYTTVMIPNIDATPSIMEADKGENK